MPIGILNKGACDSSHKLKFGDFSLGYVKNTKKFSELLSTEYHHAISEVHLLEDIFSDKKSNVVNPNIEKLRDFF